MTDPKKYTEKTEVKTETKRDSDESGDQEVTTVKTERTVEKEEEEPVIVVEEH